MLEPQWEAYILNVKYSSMVKLFSPKYEQNKGIETKSKDALREMRQKHLAKEQCIPEI